MASSVSQISILRSEYVDSLYKVCECDTNNHTVGCYGSIKARKLCEEFLVKTGSYSLYPEALSLHLIFRNQLKHPKTLAALFKYSSEHKVVEYLKNTCKLDKSCLKDKVYDKNFRSHVTLIHCVVSNPNATTLLKEVVTELSLTPDDLKSLLDSRGHSLLFYALRLKKFEVAKWLCDFDPSLRVLTNSDTRYITFTCPKYRRSVNVDLAKFLTKLGFNSSNTKFRDENYLHQVCANSHIGALIYMKSLFGWKKSSFWTLDKHGNTPLHCLSLNNHDDPEFLTEVKERFGLTRKDITSMLNIEGKNPLEVIEEFGSGKYYMYGVADAYNAVFP